MQYAYTYSITDYVYKKLKVHYSLVIPMQLTAYSSKHILQLHTMYNEKSINIYLWENLKMYY